jgi:hypothetical protein
MGILVAGIEKGKGRGERGVGAGDGGARGKSARAYGGERGFGGGK